jgi:RNA polymerase sigma factor (sigma-70 family)
VRLFRLASDDRLVALTRRGHHGAFEALVQRYQPRLLSFCRHMLGSREDAEDVLQEVFVAAYNAMLADERKINVRPWLYRIARNRSLNHLRRATATGVDSMDEYFADNGMSVPERIMQRENFRALISDIGQLAETQRTALLLREMDALSYEQIAEVMDTTVPSVKSLLVRARVGLAEAAEARQLSCDEVRTELAEVAEGLVKITPPVRRHLRDCERCRSFRKQLKQDDRVLAALAPFGLPLLLHKLLATKLGSTTGAGYAAGGAGAGTGAGIAAGSGAGAVGGFGGLSGLAGLGGAVATKAVAGLAAAALVTAGAVATQHTNRSPRRAGIATAPTESHESVSPSAIVPTLAQRIAPLPAAAKHAKAAHKSKLHAAASKSLAATSATPADAAKGTAAAGAKLDVTDHKPATVHGASATPTAEAVQVTSSTTELNSTTTTNTTDTGSSGAHSSTGSGGAETVEVTTSNSELPSAPAEPTPPATPPGPPAEAASNAEAASGGEAPGAPAPSAGGTEAPPAG